LKALGLGTNHIPVSDAIYDLETSGVLMKECTDPSSPPGFVEIEYREPHRPTSFVAAMREGAIGTPNSLRLARHSAKVASRFARILADCRRGLRLNESDRAAFGIQKNRTVPLCPGKPSHTITTLPDDIIHYCEPRILSVRECARIQSFPDWYEFRGKFTTGGDRRKRECPRYTQVGNAVPPNLARAWGNAILAIAQAIKEGELGMSHADAMRQSDSGQRADSRRKLAV
jgi:DNA (cytosine-5)-methyltransferase 1